MELTLLFDAGCPACSRIAHVIEQEVQGELSVRTLQDPAMQELLRRANPDWRWQPTLLEAQGDKVRAYVGLALGTRLIRKLGLRQALRVIQLVNRFKGSAAKFGPTNPGRRFFLQKVGLATPGIGLLLSQSPAALLSQHSTSPQRLEPELIEGEVWEGFLILPSGAAVPSMIKYPTHGIPVVCGIGAKHSRLNSTSTTQLLSSVKELIKEIDFPLYILDSSLKGIRLSGASLIRHHAGNTFTAALSFEWYSKERAMWQDGVSISAQPDFPKPFPVWLDSPPELEGVAATTIEKVQTLLTRGLMISSAVGYLYQWIAEDVLYAMHVEHGPSLEEAKELAHSLVLTSSP